MEVKPPILLVGAIEITKRLNSGHTQFAQPNRIRHTDFLSSAPPLKRGRIWNWQVGQMARSMG